MAEHTPTPWKIDGVYVIVPNGASIADCGKSPRIDRREHLANAAFIVKAVNNHEALVKALNEIAWMDEHLSTETAREMMLIARSALEHMKAPVGGSGT